VVSEYKRESNLKETKKETKNKWLGKRKRKRKKENLERWRREVTMLENGRSDVWG